MCREAPGANPALPGLLIPMASWDLWIASLACCQEELGWRLLWVTHHRESGQDAGACEADSAATPAVHPWTRAAWGLLRDYWLHSLSHSSQEAAGWAALGGHAGTGREVSTSNPAAVVARGSQPLCIKADPSAQGIFGLFHLIRFLVFLLQPFSVISTIANHLWAVISECKSEQNQALATTSERKPKKDSRNWFDAVTSASLPDFQAKSWRLR